MDNPIFQICSADTSVQSLLGDGTTLRIFPFGVYPEDRKPEKYPYCVWKLVYGMPENYLGQTPDCDWFGTRIEVYDKDPLGAREAGDAIVAAVEPHAHVTSWADESFNPTTKLYVFSFIVDWIVIR